jgi:kynurenine formamidase
MPLHPPTDGAAPQERRAIGRPIGYGLPMLSPRLTVCMFLGALVGGCVTTNAPAYRSDANKRSSEAPRCDADRKLVVDLTHTMHPAMPFWPGGVPFKMERLNDYDKGYRFHRLEMGENTGTHVDAPGHFIEGKRSIEQLRPDELVVPIAVLDVSEKVAKNPDYQISGNDVVDWEAVHGPVPVASLFVVNTGWHERFHDPAKYLNVDAEGVMHFPGFAVGAAELLVERDVVGVGIDTISFDYGLSKDFAAHKVMLGADKFIVENLNNLGKVPALGATVVIGVLPIAEGSQAPARIIALVSEPEPDEEEESEQPEAGEPQ